MTTALSLEEIAEIFRRAMRVSWVSENITGAGTTFEAPQGNAFSQLQTDTPDFSVMALLGGRGADIQKSAVHMYAWDRKERREVQLVVAKNLGAFGVKATSKIRRFADEIRSTDSSATVQGLG